MTIDLTAEKYCITFVKLWLKFIRRENREMSIRAKPLLLSLPIMDSLCCESLSKAWSYIYVCHWHDNNSDRIERQSCYILLGNINYFSVVSSLDIKKDTMYYTCHIHTHTYTYYIYITKNLYLWKEFDTEHENIW